MNFNLLLFLAILLVFPFVPYARLKEVKIENAPKEVLSAKSLKFSEVLYSKVVEASFSSKLKNDLVLSGIIRVVNPSSSEKSYKVVVREEPQNGNLNNFSERASFSSTNSDEVTLIPGGGDTIDLSVTRFGSEKSGEFLIIVLTSL